MAGMIWVSEDAAWGKASWLFYWVLHVIAREVLDSGVKASIKEIDENNLGSFVLQDYSDAQQEEIRQVVRGSLMRVSEEKPVGHALQDTVLRNIQELVDLFSAGPGA